jgi:hypothetical protein
VVADPVEGQGLGLARAAYSGDLLDASFSTGEISLQVPAFSLANISCTYWRFAEDRRYLLPMRIRLIRADITT